jgi:hypothetical protein
MSHDWIVGDITCRRQTDDYGSRQLIKKIPFSLEKKDMVESCEKP